MKKIAIDMVNTTEPCGTKTFNISFCNNLIETSFKSKNIYYVYIVKNYKKFLNKKKSKNIKFIIKPNNFSKNFYKFFWTQFGLPYEIYKNKIDTIYAPMNILPFASKFIKVKKILSIHSNLPWTYFDLMPGNFIKKYLIKKIMEVSINVCDVLIANSNYAKKEIIKKLNIRKKTFYVYLSVDIKKIKKKI